MTASDWRKITKQLKNKPVVLQKFIRHNKPKERTSGIAKRKCERCGRFGAHLNQYNLNLCRQCFREIAEEIGFKKYS
ncbi:30S ribosomal protein S14 [Candidatus Pacearchaeota archaeon]|nr:30S ribosomal protein S14 [Candidatus Pacearchaeota archaeon]